MTAYHLIAFACIDCMALGIVTGMMLTNAIERRVQRRHHKRRLMMDDGYDPDPYDYAAYRD